MLVEEFDNIPNSVGDWPVIKPRARLRTQTTPLERSELSKALHIHWGSPLYKAAVRSVSRNEKEKWDSDICVRSQVRGYPPPYHARTRKHLTCEVQ
jgi:hypothetical protein